MGDNEEKNHNLIERPPSKINRSGALRPGSVQISEAPPPRDQYHTVGIDTCLKKTKVSKMEIDEL